MDPQKPSSTVVVTGGNRGLGYECAKNLAAAGWRVILACRSPAQAEEAAEALRVRTGNRQITVMPLELTSLASVRSFARALAKDSGPPLQALVCNAGSQATSLTQTKDGFETTFQANHLGHFLLANLIVPLLQRPARIVFVSSGTHDPAQPTGMPTPIIDDLDRVAHPPQDVSGRVAYTTSKLCNILCTYEMTRRLTAAGQSSAALPLTVNAFDPGLMPGTGLAREYGLLARLVWRYVLPALRLFSCAVSSPARSGAALARLITDPQLQAVTGKYYAIEKEIPSSKASYDIDLAAQLWERSAQWTQLPANLKGARLAKGGSGLGS